MPNPTKQRWQRFDQHSFEDLQTSAGLAEWDAAFIEYLQSTHPKLAQQLSDYRLAKLKLEASALSDWLIDLSQAMATYTASFFGIDNEVKARQDNILKQSPILAFKKRCVKKALKKPADSAMSFAPLQQWLLSALQQRQIDLTDMECAVATLFQQLEQALPDTQNDIQQLQTWCRQAVADPHHGADVSRWTSFQLPQRLDPMNMVPIEPAQSHIDAYQAPWHTIKQRDGFVLTDERMSARQSVAEADYCVDCHQQAGDFCSTGFPVKKNDRSQGFKVNTLGETLTGCPVEEKISEMHWLYKRGHLLAALAMIMRDNPLCALTGHRICNECMKSCIYQKQTPVNIPQAETSVLSQVLQLPWGVELYDLLMRWNPLRAQQWVAQAHHGLRVLIMGMGPAGISLAHHLLMDGYTVVGMDGLKLEPLEPKLCKQPIQHYADIQVPLSDRTTYGFGGVAEYGITVRWDKNFLKLIYIIMMRREHFKAYGGIRFGGTMKVEDAWRLGFDHLAIAVGAGLPKALPIPHGLAPGVRQANDFLMALQLTGAFKTNSIVNLQVHLPAVVIGGGLTGVDTATEVQAYYTMQVERILKRYEELCQQHNEKKLKKIFSSIHPKHLDDFLIHGRAIRQERLRANKAGEKPNFTPLIHQWGGVTIVYRKAIHESPAYRRNHEELTQAMMEGIFYAEGLEPKAIQLDAWGHCAALQCRSRIQDESGQWVFSDEEKLIKANSVFIATGAQPNIAYAFEHKDTFQRTGFEYQAYQAHGQELSSIDKTQAHCKDVSFGAFTSYTEQGHKVSFLGDTHPTFHGNVIKAIASGQRVHPKIAALFDLPRKSIDDASLFEQLDGCFAATVTDSEALSTHTTRLRIHSPWLAKQHRQGQFYRLQNFENSPITYGQHALQMEALALMPSKVDSQQGSFEFLIDNKSASARLAQHIKANTQLSLMGPTGNSSKVEEGQTIMFVGDFSSLTLLLSLGDTLRLKNNRLFWLLYPTDEPLVETDRVAKLVEHIYVFSSTPNTYCNQLTDITVPITSVQEAFNHCFEYTGQSIDKIYFSGSPDLLRTLGKIRQQLHTINALSKHTSWIANINAPMQCMLKGVCAQCLVWQQDPKTQQRTKSVYACSWHQQPMAMVDPDGLIERHLSNASTAKLNALWLEQVLRDNAPT